MFFRNAVFFRFPTTTRLDGLASGLDECQLKPVGPLELSSRGFISPLGRDSDELFVELQGAIWLAVGTEHKILPAAVVNDLLAKKLAEIEEREGRKPGGRTRKRIKDELVTELLPKAFVQPGRVDAVLLIELGLVVVDTSSRKVAENVVTEIRRALGSFPALPLNAEAAPRSVMTAWVEGESLADGLQLGDECELRDPVDQGAVVRCQRQELQGDEVAKHLEAGKQCTRVALSLSDHISFLFGEDLIVRKLKFLEGAVESLESFEAEDLRAEYSARLALMAGEIRALFDLLSKAFRFSSVDADAGTEPPSRSASDSTSPRRAADRLRRMAAEDGVSSVTISAGGKSVTLTADEFMGAAEGQRAYDEAVAIVRETGNTGISHLQRRMKLGYNRAARLIEAMELRGVLSQPNHRGERTVLADKEPA